MKRFYFIIVAAVAALTTTVQLSLGSDSTSHSHPGTRVDVLVDNDLCGDGDGLFHLVHQLLCTSSEVKGIVGAHVGTGSQPWGQMRSEGTAKNNAEISVDHANEILDLLDRRGKVKVKTGAPEPMKDSRTAILSEGAKLIIEEARKASPERPLYLLFGGPLTDIASAWLMDSSISKNVVLIWIGGQEYPFGHPFPPEHLKGRNLVEYNLRLDINAAKTVFNDSDLVIWQIPRDVYRESMYSMAELDDKIFPLGKIGAYLSKKLGGFARLADTYVLGDSLLCLISTLTTTFEPGAASSFYVETKAPHITDEGLYDFSQPNRNIIVYKTIDTRLLFSDMESRFRLQAKKLN